jgi:hypothetical protein
VIEHHGTQVGVVTDGHDVEGATVGEHEAVALQHVLSEHVAVGILDELDPAVLGDVLDRHDYFL